MNTGERKVLIAGVVIVGLVAARSWSSGKPATGPLEGGIVAVGLLALLAAFGGKPADLAGNFAMLIVLAVVLSDLPDILANAQKGK